MQIKRISRYLLPAALAAISFKSLAQDKDNIIPVTPEASALSKSINFPAGTHTGVPNISIPLHTVEAGGLSLPISLSYHAGGFRINEQSGNIGLGWSLSLELQITRQINGLDDFVSNGYYYNEVGPFNEGMPGTLPYTNPDVLGLLDIAANKKDYQPDRFSFSLLNKSGTFYFLKGGSGVQPKAVTIPTEDIIIEPLATNPSADPDAADQGFKITDVDGTQYWFDKVEVTRSNHPTIPGNFVLKQVTAWKCSKIVNASKTDTIYLYYSSKNYQYAFSMSEQIVVLDNTEPCQENIIYPDQIALDNNTTYEHISSDYSFYKVSTPKYFNTTAGSDAGFHIVWKKSACVDGTCSIPMPCEQCQYECVNGVCQVPCDGSGCVEDKKYSSANGEFSSALNVTAIGGLYLDKITFSTGEIDFSSNSSGFHLNTINVTNYQNSTIKTIRFIQSKIEDGSKELYKVYAPDNGGQEYSSDGTWYLDRLEFTNSDGEVENYSFEYVDKYSFNNHTKGSDPWGGVKQNLTGNMLSSNIPLPEQQITSPHVVTNYCAGPESVEFKIGNGDIWPDETGMKHGLLWKIFYPTKGYTEFSFSPNKFRNVNQGNIIQNAGGLRIESIKYFDGRNSIPAWEKIYKYGEGEDGTGIIRSIPSESILSENDEGTYYYEQTKMYVLGSGVGQQVTERQRTFVPNAITDLLYATGAPVHYVEVAEYQKDLGTMTGKTVYKYDKNPYSGYNPYYRRFGTSLTIQQTSWHMGKLDKEIHFKYVNNSFDTLKIKKYSYEPYYKPDQVFVGKVFISILGKSEAPPPVGQENYTHYTTGDFIYDYYGLQPGNMLLMKEEEVWKENGKDLSKVVDYYYDNTNIHLQPTRTATTLSDGTKQKSYTTYPPDYANETTFIKNLKDNHMFSSPIEQVTVVADSVVGGQIAKYRSDNSGLIDKTYSIETALPLPKSEFSFSKDATSTLFTSDTRYKEKLSFVYANGKPVMVQPTDNNPASYLWGYKGDLPVAKVVNATNNQIFYMGFEDDFDNGSTDPAIVFDPAGSHTGNYYRSGSYTVQFSPPSGSYYVSYWFYKDAKWQFKDEQTYNPASGLQITEERIDDVRVYPKGAQMTTYTFKPLVGMTSVTDPNNITTFYDYDKFGRLKTIRDSKGNIIKTYSYHNRK